MGYTAVKAGIPACVAGSCADLFHIQNQGVLITVGADFHNALDVAGGGTLVPEFLARAGPINCFTDFQSAAQGFLIHVCQHQRLLGYGIHGKGRDQTIGIKFWSKSTAFLDLGFSSTRGKCIQIAHVRNLKWRVRCVQRASFGLRVQGRQAVYRRMAYEADRAYELIASAHSRGRLAHAFLISGAPGSGKENLSARLIQMVSGAQEKAGFDLFGEPVVVETPPLDDLESGWIRIVRPKMKSRRIGVDEIRNLEHTLHLAAPGGACKVGVIVEADRMNDQAANAFLKTLEEPPQNTLLLLLTANPHRLLPTILSRCVRVPLLGGRGLLEEGGAELVSALNLAAKRGFGTPISALHLKAVFTSFLAESREAADAAAKAAEKEETAAYKDATDGAWLKEREVFHKAAAEAEYLESRSRLFDILLAWMADLLRLKVKSGHLDFPESAPLLKTIADQESETKLLQRMQALDSLRRTLETNAFEPLAIEVGFLKAFG